MTPRRANGTWMAGGGPGRTKGVRNRLAGRVFGDILEHWEEPSAKNPDKCKGQIALELMYRERPADYCRLAVSVLPRELTIETSMSDMSDDDLDAMLEQLRARVIDQRADAAMTVKIETPALLPVREIKNDSN
jgi:hypothetical protein